MTATTQSGHPRRPIAEPPRAGVRPRSIAGAVASAAVLLAAGVGPVVTGAGPIQATVATVATAATGATAAPDAPGSDATVEPGPSRTAMRLTTDAVEAASALGVARPTLEAMAARERGLVEVRLVLRTGREIVGLLAERDGRKLVVDTGGDQTTVDLADTVEYEVLGPVVDTFAALRGATDPGDIPSRLGLVRWLRDHGAIVTAYAEVVDINRGAIPNQQASQLQLWLGEQIKLEAAALEAKAAAGTADTDDAPLADEDAPDEPPADGVDSEVDDGPARRPLQGRDRFPVLTSEEINLLRVYEVDFEDPPRMVITRSLVQRFIEEYGDHELMPRTQEGREALLRRDALTVLDLMFRVQARPLYGEVRMLEDPASFEAFRDDLHRTWLAGSRGSCASSSCHGGQEAGRLYLNNERPNSDATVYTNFLILDRFVLDDGTPMINYEEPALSPLLQMALPADKAQRPHPVVDRTAGRRGWRPYFRDADDLRFRRAVEWIKSMYQPRPDYPIEYQPPVPRGVRRAGERPETPTER